MSTDSPTHYQPPLFAGGYTDVRLDLTLHFQGPANTTMIGWTVTDSLTDEVIGIGCDAPTRVVAGDRQITAALRQLLEGVRAQLSPF